MDNITRVVVSYGGGMGGCSWTLYVLNFEKPKENEMLKLYSNNKIKYEINQAFIVNYEYNYDLEGMSHLGYKKELKDSLRIRKTDSHRKNVVL